MNNWSNLFWFGAGLILGGYFIHWRLKRKNKKEKVNVVKAVLLFKPESSRSGCGYGEGCKCNGQLCNINNLRSLICAIECAKSSIDLCMYLFTSNLLYSTVLKMFKKGIRVRWITDKEMCDDAANCKLGSFYKECIPICVKNEPNVTMHNKFIIIDRKLLIMGSFNWTNQAFAKNYETGILTSEKEFVDGFVNYFESIWQ